MKVEQFVFQITLDIKYDLNLIEICICFKNMPGEERLAVY